MRPTTEISGGELQKVILARALAQEPKVLLLDEPINHLDPVNQIEVMSLLHAVTKDLNIASLLVTHDLNSALRFADRFILLKDGVIYAHGGREIITPAAIRDVFSIDAIIEEVAGIPVVIPLLKEIRPHRHYHVHEHRHGTATHRHKHHHEHSHKVDEHIYDHEHDALHDSHEHPHREQPPQAHRDNDNERTPHE
jgi:ABC-type sulfate/molybdate transport systems ATPase subunit